jgi:2-polyprenyl-3-methyl-5-hydroxy-6-metoxy-1,4-benzoquinol methylase
VTARPVAATTARTCALCHDRRFVPTAFGGYRYRGVEYTIVRCESCGFMFVDPIPAADVVMAVYGGNEYFEKYRVPGSGSVGYNSGLDEINPYDEATLALLAEFQPAGRLLDVGCAGGRFLARARDRGYAVAGVEPNPAMAAHGRDALGLDVRLGTLSDVRALFGDGAFDVIHLADVLEHLIDLEDSLARIRQALVSGGLVVLQQPVTYNRSLFSLLLHANMLLKADRYSPYPPLHVWEFTPATLRRLLAAHGFEVLRLRSFEGPATPLPAPTVKKRVTAAVKALSCRLSNWPLLAKLELGDRALVIARKS